MKKTLWFALTISAAVVYAAIATISVVLGGCDSLLELTSGSEVPMKCQWAFQATAALGVAGVLLELFALTLKTSEGYRASAVTHVILGALIVAMPLGVIGTCASPEMACNTTKLFVCGLAGVVMALSIIQLIASSQTNQDKPKARL